MSTNPLLQVSTLPNKAPNFTAIKEEHYKPAFEEAIAQARSAIDAIKTNSEASTFENTLVALETASETLGDVSSVFYNQLSAVGGDGLHELAMEIGPITAAFSSDIILDPDLFARIKDVHDNANRSEMTAEQITLLDDTYKDFVRGGALLDESKKERLREISQALSTLGPEFMQNVNKSSESYELKITDENDLSGLPETIIEAAKHAAEEKGYQNTWLFTLDYPSYGPFMQYADNRSLREDIWRAFSHRGGQGDYDNSEIILKIVALRDERAKVLGYDTHADYVLERRMALKPATVHDFLDTLAEAYLPAAKADLAQLKAFAQENGGPDEIMPWDVGYYSEKQKQALYNFSSEDLRPYFPLAKVLSGCFEHFTKLFDLEFKANKDYVTWHNDVEAYDVIGQKTGKFIGTLFADFYPRTGKKPGAWKTSYRDQGLYRGKIEAPVIAIVCNFTKPTADTPSLLTFGEVTTLFHEMGHAVHALLSDVTYRSLSGTSVLWDFVELPSQVQENWCYETETLALISGHHKTGEAIPADLVNKLRAAKNYMVGWGGLRQVTFAKLDLAWHTARPDSIQSVESFEDENTKDTALFPRYGGVFSTSFSHIFAGGYSAGYYSYKWAEVLDADTFELFLEKGLYDQTTAQSYKDNILSKGGTEHPEILYERFRGRAADPHALLRREGLETEKKAA